MRPLVTVKATAYDSHRHTNQNIQSTLAPIWKHLHFNRQIKPAILCVPCLKRAFNCHHDSEYLDRHDFLVLLQLDVKFTCSHMWGQAVGLHQETEKIQTNRFHWKKVCCCCYDALHLENKIYQMYVDKKLTMWSTLILTNPTYQCH